MAQTAVSRPPLVQQGPALRADPMGASLLFGLRMWASICLALFVAFHLELDNPFWAGTSAAVVCQPQLGASLRKGWFRMIGTVIGATVAVVLTACFPQDRVAFLGLLAAWCGLCVFLATLLRNFASYAASLAGYTASIIAADALGATGGPSADIFMLAVWRATEICIGIACAGIVLAGTDFGSARQRLTRALAAIGTEIANGLARTLVLAGAERAQTETQRRELTHRVIALEPVIDQVLGESGHVRYHATTLQATVQGLLAALAGWRGVARHLTPQPDVDRQGREVVLQAIPPALRSGQEATSPERWAADPLAARRTCDEALRALAALPVSTPALRLLADEASKVFAGLMRALAGLALLIDASGRSLQSQRGFQCGVPDWLPPVVNAIRAFLAVAAVELFWVATAWPGGASAIVFVSIVVLLLAPRGDVAFAGSIALALGTGGAVVFAAIIKFAVLPALDTFPAFCIGIGLFLVPAGFAIAQVQQQPAAMAVFTAMGVNFMPLLAPTNPMSYDTAQFYNAALAIIVGCSVAPLAFRLLPPLSPAVRTRRLLALSLRDLRRLAADPTVPRSAHWEARMYARIAALPDQAEPIQRARLLAALAVGTELIELRRIGGHLGVAAGVDTALAAFAQGDGATAAVRLRELDGRLATSEAAGQNPLMTLRARSRILSICEAVAEHAPYFEAGATT